MNEEWLKQMEELQKQIDEAIKIMVESWKPIESFLYNSRHIINSIARDLGLITTRKVHSRKRIRRYYKYIIREKL